MITYFHRNKKAGYSIDKVTQLFVSQINYKQEYYVPAIGASVKSLLKNIFFVYRHRNTHAINHITGDIHYCMIALIGCKSVLTIHDTVLLDFNKRSKLKRFFIKLLWFDLPMAIANRVVCISEETRKSLLKYSKRNDIEVIHNIASFPCNKEVASSFTEEKVKILIIGTSPNKNVLRSIEAIEGLNVVVTIVGRIDKNLLEIIERYRVSYINKTDLTDDEIIEEYRHCNFVIFCSLFEGFGMPILEANAIGRPILCSDIPIMHEVAGEAALFVDPTDVNAIKTGVNVLISDENLRKKLIIKGYENIQRFSPQVIVSKWKKLYSSI